MGSRIAVFVAFCLTSVSSFWHAKWFDAIKCRHIKHLKSSSQQSDFDPIETDKVFREIAGNMGKPIKSRDPIIDVAVGGQVEVSSIGEETYRKYPFADLGLPLLLDHNNYYSGKFQDSFWHQNADQVLVFIPLDDSVSKSEIKANFEATKLSISVKGETIVAVRCFERIIPDGSFWIIEEDKNGQRYIQLDLEKRYRMLNWRAFFGPPPAINDDPVAAQSRSKLLESLMSANKGLSKLTGVPAETMDEMMKNPDFLDVVTRPADLETKMTVKDASGQTISLNMNDLGFGEFRQNEPMTLAELDTNDPTFPYKSQDEDDNKMQGDEADDDDYLEEEDDEDEDEDIKK
ncbi:hypothetical protein EON65_14010 [archaeon]|nr:MAG: hypothetical protein EON65_14010 [archaeon]